MNDFVEEKVHISAVCNTFASFIGLRTLEGVIHLKIVDEVAQVEDLTL